MSKLGFDVDAASKLNMTQKVLDTFMEQLNTDYVENIQMTSHLNDSGGTDEYIKWVEDEIKFHQNSINRFNKKYVLKGNETRYKYYYDFYKFHLKGIKRLRNNSIKFMSDSEKKIYNDRIKKYDLEFQKKIHKVVNYIKNPHIHTSYRSVGKKEVNKMLNPNNQGCLLLFLIPLFFYVLYTI